MIERIVKALTQVLSVPEIALARGERRRERPAGERAASGAVAEEAATALLRRKGFRILCRNRVNAIGELDIVARDGDTVVFVEVRSRREGSAVSPKDTLTRPKRRRLAKAAELFCRQHKLTDLPVRIDFVGAEIDGEGKARAVEHLENVVGEDGR